MKKKKCFTPLFQGGLRTAFRPQQANTGISLLETSKAVQISEFITSMIAYSEKQIQLCAKFNQIFAPNVNMRLLLPTCWNADI